MSGAADIAAERNRQISSEGYSPADDDRWQGCELLDAAEAYVNAGRFTGWDADVWPWDPQLFKPGERRRNLVKAGALIAAEIDRLDRLTVGEK